MTRQFYDLPALLSHSKWHTIQRHFSEVLGITLVVVDLSGTIISEITKPSWLPEDAFRVCVFSIEHALRSIRTSLFRDRLRDWKEAIPCPLGFYSYVIPLSAGGETVGYLLAGPTVVVSRPDPENYRIVAAELSQRGISQDTFMETAALLKVFSYTSIRSTVELLFDIASSVMEPYRVVLPQRDIASVAGVSVRQNYQVQKERVMSALLDVAAGFMNAERASVFLYDSARKELYLGASRGIPDEIAQNIRICLGDRIIGTVASTKRTVVLREEIDDPQVRSFCHMPEIKCSVVMPVQVNKRLVGVLAVATYQKAKARFFDRNLPVMNNFVKLAETTLQNLSQKNHSV